MKDKKRYLYLVLGNLISAYSVIYILRPNDLMTGGITGLSRVLEVAILKAFDLPPMLEQYLYSIIYYLMAILVLVLAYIFLGKADALKILFLS
ncbi:MAG TPA: YitT family protein, partial [Haloplasmataceae bacterium]